MFPAKMPFLLCSENLLHQSSEQVQQNGECRHSYYHCQHALCQVIFLTVLLP